MTIETKCNINDKVYVLLFNTVFQCDVKEIIINVSSKNRIQYLLKIPGKTDHILLEEYVFKTKEELLASL
jgi:hypothetical protein